MPHPPLFLLFLFLSVIQRVVGNTEKIIFSANTIDCTPFSSIPTDSFSLSTATLVHPYTSLQLALPAPFSSYLYRLEDLDPQSNYEVRLSYPATVPTDFQFTLICKNNRVWGVHIQGQYAGVSHQPGIHSMPVPVNIVLEKLALGVVYHDIYKVIIMILIVIFVGYFIFIPRIKQFLLQGFKNQASIAKSSL